MRNANSRPHHYGSVKLFGYAISVFRKSVRFCRVCWFHDRNHRSHCVVTRVLFVLRGKHTRIIGGKDDKAAINAGIGRRKQWVSANIHTNMFHGNQDTRTCSRSANSDFKSDFFVWTPFSIYARQLRKRFHRFR